MFIGSGNRLTAGVDSRASGAVHPVMQLWITDCRGAAAPMAIQVAARSPLGRNLLV
jgi:hypothetical protein